MLAGVTEILANAVAEHTAVPAFATYNLEMVQAVVAAAEQTGRPVIMLAGSSHFNHAGRSALISIALHAARETTATIGVHLDHCRDLAEIEHCVRAGHSSVMVDGSHLPFEDNIELTRAHDRPARGSRIRRPHRCGRPRGGRRERPWPHQHPGVPRPGPARRDPDAVPMPLVLHGASGLPDEQLGGPIGRGVAKININTELRQAYLAAAVSVLPSVRPATTASPSGAPVEGR